MKTHFLISFSFFISCFCFGQVNASKIDTINPKLNYIVDKFEHLVFVESYLSSNDIWIAGGYEFVYNFHDRIRLITGLGFGYGQDSYAFSPRSCVQFGKKLTRFEIGLTSQFISRRYAESLTHYDEFFFTVYTSRIYRQVVYQIGPTFGLRFRHFRNIQAGISWNPIFTVNNNELPNPYPNPHGSSPLINFSAQLRIFINSKKRRKELGKWRGVHPFRGVNYTQQINSKNNEIRKKRREKRNSKS